MFLNDQETATDLLYYESIAKTVVRLIRDSPGVPVTIGVHGDWGAGKSSVLKMVQATFANDERVLCLWFNGWIFEGFEDAKTVVLETIIEELRRARPTSRKVADAALKALKRVDWLKLARKAGGLAFTAFTGIPTVDQARDLLALASGIASTPAESVSLDAVRRLSEGADEFIKAAPDSTHVPAHIHAFRDEFKELLDAADIDQLVVVVDDLDRCLPTTAIATLEAIRLFLFVERTAFVIGADETMIEYAVREHFPDLPPSSGSVSYARNYLEKLIQVPFRIPALGLAETRVYVLLLLAENALGADDERFVKLLEAARKQMTRPWMSTGLDRAAVEVCMEGSIPSQVSLALAITAHVAKILSDGTRGNPRQIKRFLNSMMLRHAIAEERGFGADVKRTVLAKIMLAERFYPDFYEQVARLAATAVDGKPDAVARLEASVRAPSDGDGEDDEKRPSGKGRKSTRAATEDDEWLKSEWARAWAAIEPPLAGVDLRPYVFVTRDKRSSLGAANVASHLESLVEKLMGSKMAVSAVSADLAKLTGNEPEAVFEALRTRVLEADDMTSKPAGVDGMTKLVEMFPSLQRRLLGFVRDLPTTNVGAWVSTSWGTAFKDPAVVSEFQAVAKGWSEQSENEVLKTAARLSSQIRKG